jgi:hypothetical protein
MERNRTAIPRVLAAVAAVRKSTTLNNPSPQDWRTIFRGAKMMVNRKEGILPNTKTSSPAAQKSRAAKTAPTREQIALRAYHIFLERCGAPGNEFEDWTRAERELLETSSKPRRKAAPKSKAA